MNIVIGSDHGGYELKCVLAGYLKSLNHNVYDVGANSREACDYPDFAFKVAECVAAKRASFGIMIDGAGIGSAMCANRVEGVLAATCNELFVTRNAREHNNANVMCLGSQVIGPGLAKKLVDVFLETKFEGGRHLKRVDKILAYLNGALSSPQQMISTIVERVMAVIGNQGTGAGQTASSAAADLSGGPRELICEDYIKNKCEPGSTLTVKKGTMITSLAMDMARKKKITVLYQ
jgi:ribose 5-phosphate isomerase B